GSSSGRRAYPGRRAGCPPPRSRDRAVPVFTASSLGEGGARLCPSGLAAGTPQAFPAASLAALKDRPGSSPPVMKDRCAPRPAPIRQVRAGARLWDVPTPVPRALLSATLAGHTPSGGADPPRLCQGNLGPGVARVTARRGELSRRGQRLVVRCGR